MAAMINIRRDVQDPFYRYKMPKIQSKIEGKGNGIKTVIPNMSDVAKALNRPPSYTTKFFGCELGAQVKMDDSKDRYIVNGAHDAPKLQQILDGFITKFVLCGSCLNPETVYVIQKDNIIKDCKACGQKTQIEMTHKLSTYILKHPPQLSNYGTAASSGKSTKKDSKKQKDDDSDQDELQEDDEEEQEPEVDESWLQKEAEDLKKVESRLDDWSVDVSQEAIQQRQQEFLSEEVTKKLNLESEDKSEDLLEVFAKYLKDNPKAVVSEILDKIDELEIKRPKAVAVMVQVLFDEKIRTQLKTRKGLFNTLNQNEKCQKAFLGGLERLVSVHFPQLKAQFPLILKDAYDLDLLDEEIILAWGQKPSKRYVDKETAKDLRKKAKPFLEWLENAEEETSEEE